MFDVEKLRDLPALRKRHYSDGLGGAVLANPPLLEEIARICGAVSVQGEWVTREQLAAAVAACQAQKALLAINYRPFAPARVGRKRDPRDVTLRDEEIDLLKARLNTIATSLSMPNCVRFILLDCEQFVADWWPTEALLRLYAAIREACRQCFPSASVCWFGSGLRTLGMDDWPRPFGYFPSTFRPEYRAVSLYFPAWPDLARRIVEATAAVYPEHLIAYVSLGCGWAWSSPTQRQWIWELKYSRSLDRRLGQWLASNKPPWDRVANVVFYPSAFNPRIPDWGERFVVYVRGATAP